MSQNYWNNNYFASNYFADEFWPKRFLVSGKMIMSKSLKQAEITSESKKASMSVLAKKSTIEYQSK